MTSEESITYARQIERESDQAHNARRHIIIINRSGIVIDDARRLLLSIAHPARSV